MIAPIGVRFAGKPQIDKDSLELGIRTTSATDASKIAIVCLAKCGRKTERSHRSLRPKPPKIGRVYHSIVVPLPKRYEWAKYVLMYKQCEVDRYEMRGIEGYESNPRWKIFSEIAGNMDAIRDLPAGDQLEANLEVLFHLLNFYTANYGGRKWPGIKTPPDVIAFPVKGDWFIVLECTSREVDIHNKLGKLSTRCRELSIAADGMKAYPVIFTALQREAVTKTDREKCSKERIAVVTSDDLPKLLDAVRSKADNEETLAILQGLVPGDF